MSDFFLRKDLYYSIRCRMEWFLLNFGHKKTGTYNIPVYGPVLVE